MNEQKDCRHGRMLYNAQDIYIGRSLKKYGEFSEGECDVFRQIVQPGTLVLDLGANIGAHTVVLSKIVGETGRVLAFEPQRIVFQNLCANVAINSLTNVYCRQQAVGQHHGQLVVPLLDYSRENNFGGLALGGYSHGESVEVITIDELALEACHFIKLDIEGMEREAILGAEQTIRRFKPVIYVENDRKEKSNQLIQTIHHLDYEMYWHTPPLYNPNNFFGDAENVFGAVVSCNMICIHKSLPHQIDLRPVDVSQIDN